MSLLEVFKRVLKNGDQHIFDSEGKLLGMLDRYNRRTTYNYDSEDRLESIVYSNGKKTLFVYGSDGYIETITDPLNRVTEFTHDSSGHLLTITDPDNTTRSFIYGINSRLSSQEDKLSRVKNYIYDDLGSVTKVIYSEGTQTNIMSQTTKFINKKEVVVDSESNFSDFTDPRGYITRVNTNGFGSATEVIDALNQKTMYERDENNNVIGIIDKRGNRAEMTYDDLGNLKSVFERSTQKGQSYEYLLNPSENFNQPIAMADGNGNITNYKYDFLGNLTQVKGPNNQFTTFDYDGYLLDSMTQLGEDIDATFYFEYDENSNPVTIRDTARQTLNQKTYDLAGNILTETDALGNETVYTYDAMNRLLTSTDARGGVIQYTYDTIGNLNSITDERNKITSFEYDKRDRLVKRIDPSLFVDQYEYDASGNMIIMTDRNDSEMTYDYDGFKPHDSEKIS